MLSSILAALLISFVSADCNVDKFNKSPEDCKKLDVVCMSRIDMSKLNTACLKNIPIDDLKNMPTNSAKQLISLPIKQLPLEGDFLYALFKRHTWDKNNTEPFLVNLAQNPDYVNKSLEALQQEPDLAARIFNGNNAEHHTNSCTKLTKEIVSQVTTTFFAKVKVNCFKVIPDVAFEGIDEDSLAALPPAILRHITVKQASKVPKSAFTGLTNEQAKNWGHDFAPPEGEDKDAKQKYLDEHPCSIFKSILPNLKKPTQLALGAHCKVNPNTSADRAKLSTGTVIFCGAVLAFLFL